MYYAARVTREKCTGCKLCILSCPEPNVIDYERGPRKVAINEARCKGCGLCVAACSKDALSVSQA
jgi:Pyruvate/2-oxoacid:ferredoxin oxidoreductase delta subunit